MYMAELQNDDNKSRMVEDSIVKIEKVTANKRYRVMTQTVRLQILTIIC